jgi:enoyl-CoA hydratase/carnithine racemase
MCLAGRAIEAEEAREWVLFSKIVNAEDLAREAVEVAKALRPIVLMH